MAYTHVHIRETIERSAFVFDKKRMRTHARTERTTTHTSERARTSHRFVAQDGRGANVARSTCALADWTPYSECHRQKRYTHTQTHRERPSVRLMSGHASDSTIVRNPVVVCICSTSQKNKPECQSATELYRPQTKPGQLRAAALICSRMESGGVRVCVCAFIACLRALQRACLGTDAWAYGSRMC